MAARVSCLAPSRSCAPRPGLKMSDVVLDRKAFFKRAQRIFDAWESPDEDTEVLRDLKALGMMMGDASDEASSYNKISALQVNHSRP